MTHEADQGFDTAPDEAHVAASTLVPPRAMLMRAVNALHIEVMVLADEACAVFSAGLEDDPLMPPAVRVGLSCEALKTTTRLMHVIAWLLDQRAVLAGEWRSARPPAMGRDAPADHALCAHLSPQVADIVRASERLAARARALEGLGAPRRGHAPDDLAEGPARALQARLSASI